MNENQVTHLMESSKTQAEWDANCGKVQEACGGYPDFWYRVIIQSGLQARAAAKFGVHAGIQTVAVRTGPVELGKKSEMSGTEHLRRLDAFTDFGSLNGRPERFPRSLRTGEKVIVGYDQGLGERLFSCETLAEMQYLYAAYARGGAISIRWYACDEQKLTPLPAKS